jgi:O-antigen ligase
MVLNLILPVFLLTISKSVKTKNDGYKTMQFISLFVILSFLPFVCNILQQNRIAVNEDLVSPDRQIGLSGLFVSVHGASFMLAYSVLSLILILQILKNTWQKFLLLIIAIIGISFTIQTYARTGFIMLIAGIVTFLFYKIKLRKIPQVVFLLILTTIVSYGLLQADSTMWQRLTGNAEGQEYGNADSYSSGRLQLWENSLKSYTENHSIFEFVFGIGESELLARNGRKGGAHFAHNGFINTLTTNGIIGLTLLLLFLKNWFSLIRKPTPNNIYASKYSMSVFIMYLVYMLFQGGASVYDSMFIALSIHIKRLAFTEQKCVK